MAGMVNESFINDLYHANQVTAHSGHPEQTMMVNAAAATAAGHPHHVNVNNPYMIALTNASMPINTSQQVNVRRYPCRMCSAVFHSRAEYRVHRQSHMREPKPYRCPQCPKCFANSSNRSQHMRIHLGIKRYQCEVCKSRFTQMSHLQQHNRTHTGDKPYKCQHPGCTKAFSQLSNLQSHSRCHQSDKPFKCNSCYKFFHDEAGLLKHILKHKEFQHLKTHICKFCGKSFTQETYLARHMVKHLDETDHKSHLGGSGSKPGMLFPSQEMRPFSGHPFGRMATEDFMGDFMGVSYTPYPSFDQMVDFSDADAAAKELMPATKANYSALPALPRSHSNPYGYEERVRSHQMSDTMQPYDLHNGANQAGTSAPTMLEANMWAVTMVNTQDGMVNKHLRHHECHRC